MNMANGSRREPVGELAMKFVQMDGAKLLESRSPDVGPNVEA